MDGMPQHSRADSRAADVVETVAAGLRSRGERMTQPRRAVVATLAQRQEHLSAEEILLDAGRSYPGVNRSTIYRALETLADLGVVQHIHSGRAATMYHLTTEHGPHAHATCDGCGRVIDLPPEVLAGAADRLRADEGFVLDPGHVALSGLCRDCVGSGPAH
jgi:Fur family transcriptional regulator, ferric uptake regulator